ncbi:aminotransferase class V-fold PLP-dependent enzyme, partial [Glutamicibacter creatinolyticus]
DFAASQVATMAISAHKIGGPVGIGALLVRRDVVLTPVQHGGGHERKLRS